MASRLKPGTPKATDAQARLLARALGKDGPTWIVQKDGGAPYHHPTLAAAVAKGWLAIGKPKEIQPSPGYVFHHTEITSEGERALEVWLMVRRFRTPAALSARAP